MGRPCRGVRMSGVDRRAVTTHHRERATGIEPAFRAWEARVLPLNYARVAWDTLPARTGTFWWPQRRGELHESAVADRNDARTPPPPLSSVRHGSLRPLHPRGIAGWDGNSTLELSNVANLPITVYPGMKIGQIRGNGARHRAGTRRTSGRDRHVRPGLSPNRRNGSRSNHPGGTQCPSGSP